MSTMTEDRQNRLNSLSDLFKDARGFRPPYSYLSDASKLDDGRLQDLCDRLQTEVEESINAEAAASLRAQKSFEETITRTMEAGARSREEALRWMVQSIQGRPSDAQDVESLLWQSGVDLDFSPMYLAEMGFTRRGMVWVCGG